MLDSTRDFFDTLAKVLLRCWIFGFVLGLFSFVVFMLTGEIIDGIHGKMFGVTPHESMVIRVRGDGRDYNFRLNVPRSIGRNYYRQSFTNKKDEWIEVTLPMEKFVATWRGRVFPNEKFDNRQVDADGPDFEWAHDESNVTDAAESLITEVRHEMLHRAGESEL